MERARRARSQRPRELSFQEEGVEGGVRCAGEAMRDNGEVPLLSVAASCLWQLGAPFSFLAGCVM